MLIKIADEWEKFQKMVIPVEASELQKIEMRRAFYAGFYDMLNIAISLGDPKVPEEEGIRIVEALRNEADQFYKNMGRGIV